jgi:uncharacterized protein (DUF1015 family)
MADIRPFCGVRPAPGKAAEVASPPYDVLNSKEARTLVGENPHSYLHIVKPEIDLPEGVDLHDDRVYAKGRENLDAFMKEGWLVQEDRPCLYLYRQVMGDHVQTGLVCGASCQEYVDGLIKKHEHTRKVKEDDRTRHVETLGANTGPVFLTYRAVPEISALVAKLTAASPEEDFTSEDGIRHVLWVVSDEEQIQHFQELFQKLPALYVADGHHRSASAARVYADRKAANPDHTGNELYAHFLSVIFPDQEMKIMDYNRVVLDLNGLTPESFLEKVKEVFEVSEGSGTKPQEAQSYEMYLEGRWYLLRAKKGSFPEGDPVRSLDVAILQDNLLEPVLGIKDPRTSDRIDFVGGIRGMKELERRCQEGAVVAFALHPTSIKQLLAIADADEVMPPKSTWFEPKLRSGMVTRLLDNR